MTEPADRLMAHAIFAFQ